MVEPGFDGKDVEQKQDTVAAFLTPGRNFDPVASQALGSP